MDNMKELLLTLQTLEKMRNEIIKTIADTATHTGYEGFSKEVSDEFGRFETLTMKNEVGDSFNVHHFAFLGALPLYKEGFQYTTEAYYHTLLSLFHDDFEGVTPLGGVSCLAIYHFFENEVIRDIDNRNRKYIIDMVRGTGLIRDDNWKELSLYERGFKDSCNHIQVYLFEDINKNSFFKNFSLDMQSLVFRPKLTDTTRFKIVEFPTKKNEEIAPLTEFNFGEKDI